MAMNAENRYIHPEQLPRKKRRPGRRGPSPVVWLMAVLLVVAVGFLCWRGIQLAGRGIQAAISFLAPEDLNLAPEDWDTGGDREAPVLSGIHDFTVYQGETISYLNGVAATDDGDAAPKITVDSTGVDLNQPGTYQITYTATDASGNMSHATATVTVLEKGESYVEPDIIYAAVDAKLEQILRKNATVEQQVHDIYAWARLNLRYGGHSDRTDYRQTAYEMLTQEQGDCFGYFAVTKLMFERLGIPNIDVRKVKNSDDDSDHFWSLVSLDGGETWYHFDATPRAGEGDDFCLVTDAFLDAYSDSHDGSHNRDKSLYPPTP